MFGIPGRRLLAIGAFVLWFGAVGEHVRREYFKPLETRLAEATRRLDPATYFYAVRLDGRTIGLATSRLDTVPGGFVLEERLVLDLPAMGKVERAVMSTTAELGPALDVRRFAFDLTSAGSQFGVRGTVRDGTTLDLEIRTGGKTERSEVDAGSGALLAALAPLRLAAAGGLETGREHRLAIFDPSLLATREVMLRVGERDRLLVPDSVDLDAARREWIPLRYDTVPVWRIEESYGGIKVSSWVDPDGRLVKAESPIGFVVERTEYELAQQELARTRSEPGLAEGYGPIIESTAIASNLPLSGMGETSQLVVRLADVDLEGFDLAGGRQTLRGDTLVIVREDVAGLAAGYTLPYRGGGEPASELEATPLIQATDPRIVEAAKVVAGGETDPVGVARKLNEWVYRSVSKELVPSVPSAVQVLETRRGDCNEHTILYVALARALGLPARTATGLVYLNGRFYYHAWPEVWLGEWVAVDPTLGQFPADAAHLRFVVGGLARQVELVRLMGRLRLEVQ